MNDNLRMVLIAVVFGVTIAVISVAAYWSDAQQAPVQACQALDDQRLVADCLRGLGR